VERWIRVRRICKAERLRTEGLISHIKGPNFIRFLLSGVVLSFPIFAMINSQVTASVQFT